MVEWRLQFVRYHVGWMLATILVLVSLGQFSLTQFYVIALIGYFLIAELTVAAVTSRNAVGSPVMSMNR